MDKSIDDKNKKPKFDITQLSAPGEVPRMESFNVTYTVKNKQKVRSAELRIAFYLSDKSGFINKTGTTPLLDFDLIPPLDPGEPYSDDIDLTLPADIPFHPGAD